MPNKLFVWHSMGQNYGGSVLFFHAGGFEYFTQWTKASEAGLKQVEANKSGKPQKAHLR